MVHLQHFLKNHGFLTARYAQRGGPLPKPNTFWIIVHIGDSNATMKLEIGDKFFSSVRLSMEFISCKNNRRKSIKIYMIHQEGVFIERDSCKFLDFFFLNFRLSERLINSLFWIEFFLCFRFLAMFVGIL